MVEPPRKNESISTSPDPKKGHNEVDLSCVQAVLTDPKCVPRLRRKEEKNLLESFRENSTEIDESQDPNVENTNCDDKILFTPPPTLSTSSSLSHSYKSNLITTIAIDIDSELRLKLKEINDQNDIHNNISKIPDSKNQNQNLNQSQLLTARLDFLQKELNTKNEILIEFNTMKNDIEKKKNENCCLRNRLFGLEKDTVLLQQELSVMRLTQKETLKPKEKSQITVLQNEIINENKNGKEEKNSGKKKEISPMKPLGSFEKKKEKSPLKPVGSSVNQKIRSPLGQRKGTSEAFISSKSIFLNSTNIENNMIKEKKDIYDANNDSNNNSHNDNNSKNNDSKYTRNNTIDLNSSVRSNDVKLEVEVEIFFDKDLKEFVNSKEMSTINGKKNQINDNGNSAPNKENVNKGELRLL